MCGGKDLTAPKRTYLTKSTTDERTTDLLEQDFRNDSYERVSQDNIRFTQTINEETNRDQKGCYTMP